MRDTHKSNIYFNNNSEYQAMKTNIKKEKILKKQGGLFDYYNCMFVRM